MGWKGESRRHSLSRKGIKTNIDKDKRLSIKNYVARGSKNIIPEGYLYIDRQNLIEQTKEGIYRTKNGRFIENLSIPANSPLFEKYGGRLLTPEEIISLDPETMLSIKHLSSRGRVSGNKLKIKHIIIPQTDPLLLQIDIGMKVEMEHTDDWREAQKIAIDHLEENDRYYFILLEAFPDEHPALLKQLQTNLAQGIPKTKTINGKKYKYHSSYVFRIWADVVIAKLKRRGFKVKETITSNGIIVLYKYRG